MQSKQMSLKLHMKIDNLVLENFADITNKT